MAQNNTPKIKNEEMYAYLIETGKHPQGQKEILDEDKVNNALKTMLDTLDDTEDKELKDKLKKILEIREVLFGTKGSPPSISPTEEDRYDFNVKTVTDTSGTTIEELTDPFGRKFYAKTENDKTTVYDSTGNVAEYQGKPLEDLYSSHYGWYLSQAHAGMSNEFINQTKSALGNPPFQPSTYIKEREDAIRQVIATKQKERWVAKINASQSKGGTEFVIGQGTAKIDGGVLMDDKGEVDFVIGQSNEATFTNVYGGSFKIKLNNQGKYVVSWKENGVEVSKEFTDTKQLAKMLVAGLEKMEKDYDREVQKQTQTQTQNQNQKPPTPAPDKVLDSINLNDAKNELAFSAEESHTLGKNRDQSGLKWTFGDGETVELIDASFDNKGSIEWPQSMSSEVKEKFEGHLRLKKLQETGWMLGESALKSNKRWLTNQSQNAIFIRENTRTP